MLVYCFCYVQNRAVEPNLVQNSSIRSECLATIFLSPELNKKAFTENFNFWLCRITIYHNFLFLLRSNLLNILVIVAKFVSRPQVRNSIQGPEFNPCKERGDTPLSPSMTSKLPLIVPKICWRKCLLRYPRAHNLLHSPADILGSTKEHCK